MHNQCILASEFRLIPNPGKKKKKKDYSLNKNNTFIVFWYDNGIAKVEKVVATHLFLIHCCDMYLYICVSKNHFCFQLRAEQLRRGMLLGKYQCSTARVELLK